MTCGVLFEQKLCMHGTLVLRFSLSRRTVERAMHAWKIVAAIVEVCRDGLHAKRAAALRRAVAALVAGGVLSLSALALRLNGPTALKHRIKSVDRLLGNPAAPPPKPPPPTTPKKQKNQ